MPWGSNPFGVVAANFNADGKVDLAVCNNSSHDMCVLLNAGQGFFTAPKFYSCGQYPSRLAVGDFNGDHKLYLAVSNDYSSNVSLFFGDGTGHLRPLRRFPWAISVRR